MSLNGIELKVTYASFGALVDVSEVFGIPAQYEREERVRTGDALIGIRWIARFPIGLHIQRQIVLMQFPLVFVARNRADLQTITTILFMKMSRMGLEELNEITS